MAVECVGDLGMQIILSKLKAEEVASVACVNSRFRIWASDDSIWAKFCSDDLHLSSPVDHLHNPLPSFKASYQSWRKEFRMYPWPLVLRVKQCWKDIKDWLSTNFPEVLGTLRKGASEDDISQFESSLKVRLPVCTRVLYRFCDGQEITSKEFNGRKFKNLLGLIGGYSFYEHLVNVFLFSLSRMISETKDIIRQMGFGQKSNYVVVAASLFNEKIFFLNCNNGQLYVGTRNLITDGEMIPCVPKELISSIHGVKGSHPQDAMLLWLEEHAHRLQSGVVKVRQEKKFRSINLFPEDLPLCSTAVTNGVKVRSSAVLAPEYCDLQDDSEKFFFSYSIRLSLVPEGCIINGINFSSCQLYWRHWIIRANDTVVSDVNGEAVIGKYPILQPGAEEFIYESCTPLPSSSGSIEGAFTFVPGRLADPKDSPFLVEVARVPLQVPDYIF
ncbi:hypothetical protein Leryth_021930 [Lithospermum erythrorhizon]|nr:hypothetical protein Leryth_021930 [Lithospermum erythrorhizon]